MPSEDQMTPTEQEVAEALKYADNDCECPVYSNCGCGSKAAQALAAALRQAQERIALLERVAEEAKEVLRYYDWSDAVGTLKSQAVLSKMDDMEMALDALKEKGK